MCIYGVWYLKISKEVRVSESTFVVWEPIKPFTTDMEVMVPRCLFMFTI